ncbi:stimulated by retinoic acid gene 6 protein-like [Mercenaria mercenaria]|uniref:stimulated by retinoic acid gene 6 protein-like n=1 Tax=Mercenaria mercenaria TaxID=6596 RepID=UPI00234EC929|nr:stimulated by retinoic acid gene 6 protein-like [Mercenaria mercenaria]
MVFTGIRDGQNVTIKPTIIPDSSPCGPSDSFYNELEAYSLIASAGIIICLSILEKRSSQTCRCAGQRPGIVYPVNLLDHGCDNFGYSMAFGSVASYCFRLFFDSNSLYSKGPEWSKTLYVMLFVLLYGMMFYPLFACLTTTWVFVGSFLGLGYTSLWLYSNLRTVIMCPNGSDGNFTGQDIAVQIPVLFCLVCLFLRYGYILIKHSVHIVKDRSVGRIIQQEEREHLGTKYNRMYVRELLVPACKSSVPSNEGPTEEITWHKRFKVFMRRYIYLNDPTFKYSPRIICIFTVALICAYQFGILIILASYQLKQLLPLIYPGINATDEDAEEYEYVRMFVKVTTGSMLFSFCVSSLLTIFSIFQILTNYRQNIKRMYKGDFKNLPFRRDQRHPQFILSDSLSYAGSQIAYTLWGYVIVIVMLTITCLALMYLLVLPAFGFIPRDFLKVLWNVLPGVAILQLVMISQKVFSRLLLQTRSSVNEKGKTTSSVILALDNRKVYHNVCYFLFFFYIVLGVFGCFLTILKGMVLGIMHLARLDKCGLVTGYETWDKGYMYYVSFLYVEECHRHPVLLVFCDILLDGLQGKRQDKQTYDLDNYGSTDVIHDTEAVLSNNDLNQGATYGTINTQTPYVFDKSKHLARNRWFKAYTMIRNPGLKDKEVEEEFDTLTDLGTHYRHRRLSDKTFENSVEV